MIKIEVDVMRDEASIAAKGSIMDIIAELTYAINHIYSKSPTAEGQEAFKKALQISVKNGSPMWEIREDERNG